MKEIRTAMGYVETVGLAAAIAAADAALKAANVSLIGREISKGGGMVTVKVSGNVGAVRAAVAAAKAEGERVNKVLSARVIARPAQSHGPIMGYNADTMGVEQWLETKGVSEKPLSIYRPEGKREGEKKDLVEQPKPEKEAVQEISAVPEVAVEPLKPTAEPEEVESLSPVEEEPLKDGAVPPAEVVLPSDDDKLKAVDEGTEVKPVPRRRPAKKETDASGAPVAGAKPRRAPRKARKKRNDNTDPSGRS